MRKFIYAIYDCEAHVFGKLLEFENNDIAYASIRRDVRDMYFAGEVTWDRLLDEELVFLGEYDCILGEIKTLPDEHRVHWPLRWCLKPKELNEVDKKLFDSMKEEEFDSMKEEDLEDDFPY